MANHQMDGSAGHLPPSKGVFLHASAVNVQGKALLFLGHSNAGKSTISRLLSDDYSVIADDKIWISQSFDGNWIAQDSTQTVRRVSDVSRLPGKDMYPLLAVVRIFKSDSTEMLPISQKDTCRYLMDAVFEIKLQRITTDWRTRLEWFHMIADVSRKIPGLRLTFPKNKNIIKTIKKALENEICK